MFFKALLLTTGVCLTVACDAPTAKTIAAQPAAPASTAVKTAEAADLLSDATAEVVKPASGPNAAYNAFLAKYITTENGINLVKYGQVTPQDKASLGGYIDALSLAGEPAGSKEEIMAYWFNLYNAKTVDLILENYPLESIRDIKRPWKAKRLTVAGTAMSLNDIEHGTVRARYNEPRVHYAFNCASIGCPNLKTSAWEAKTLDADLSQAARDYIGHARGVSVTSTGRINASKIFNWYKKDFGNNEQDLLNHFAKYASGERLKAIRANKNIGKFTYDWSLNGAP